MLQKVWIKSNKKWGLKFCHWFFFKSWGTPRFQDLGFLHGVITQKQPHPGNGNSLSFNGDIGRTTGRSFLWAWPRAGQQQYWATPPKRRSRVRWLLQQTNVMCSLNVTANVYLYLVTNAVNPLINNHFYGCSKPSLNGSCLWHWVAYIMHHYPKSDLQRC